MTLSVQDIIKTLPHRYPFLLVDRVEELVPGERIHAYKNVTINEEFFTGHFPHYPVMPGVLIIEALAQAAGVLSFKTMEQAPSEDTVIFFVGIDDARFKRLSYLVTGWICMSRLSVVCEGSGNTRRRPWWGAGGSRG